MGRCRGTLSNVDPSRVLRMHNDKLRTIGVRPEISSPPPPSPSALSPPQLAVTSAVRQAQVDRDALDVQVAEKAQRLAEEKARDRLFAQQMQAQDRRRQAVEAAEAVARRAAAMQVMRFQQSSQGADKALDRDLQLPPGRFPAARIGDDDPRNSPSSLQRFAGEDLRLAEQRRMQQAQNQAAWAAQHAEHAAAAAAAAAESRTAAQLERAQDEARLRVSAEEEALRRLVTRQTALTNTAALQQRRAVVQTLEQQVSAAEAAELDAMARDPCLTENPNIAASALSALRVRRDHWKGMSAAQRAAIVAQQAQQAAEHMAALQTAKEEDLAYAAALNQLAAEADRQQVQVDAARQAQSRVIAAFQRRQAEDAAAREAASAADSLQNAPRPEFFGQFESSHR